MKQADSNGVELEARLLRAVFIGDPERGNRLLAVFRSYGRRIAIKSMTSLETDDHFAAMADFVILDGFPESVPAKSAFYRLRARSSIPFLALNDSPNAVKFLHVNALSFLMIIDRDPPGECLLDAVDRLLKFKPPKAAACVCRNLTVDNEITEAVCPR